MAKYLDLEGLETLVDEIKKRFIDNDEIADYATKEYVNQLCSAHLTLKIVDELPEENISTTTIYLLPRPDDDDDPETNVYDEYIYIIDEYGSPEYGKWEIIGSTQVDLSDYVTNEDLEEALSGYIIGAVNSLGDDVNIEDQKLDLSTFIEASDLHPIATDGIINTTINGQRIDNYEETVKNIPAAVRKGSVYDKNALLAITNPEVGDFYNVVSEVEEEIEIYDSIRDWRMPTKDELSYVLSRSQKKIRLHVIKRVDGEEVVDAMKANNGICIFPDDWDTSAPEEWQENIKKYVSKNTYSNRGSVYYGGSSTNYATCNSIEEEEWKRWEAAGAIFLGATGTLEKYNGVISWEGAESAIMTSTFGFSTYYSYNTWDESISQQIRSAGPEYGKGIRAIAPCENGRFTYNSNGDKCDFSTGNLQYNLMTGEWRNATDGFITLCEKNVSAYTATSPEDAWIDCHAWGCSGWENPDGKNYTPGTIGGDASDYLEKSLVGDYENADPAKYNDVQEIVTITVTYPRMTDFVWTGDSWDSLGGVKSEIDTEMTQEDIDYIFS